MMFLIAPATVRNRAVFELRRVPRKFFDRGQAIIPRGGVFTAVFWRLVFEHVLTRYLIALLPFPALLFAFPESALPISQAPLAMFALVYFVETKILAVSKEKRPSLIDDDAMARGLDQLAVRGRRILSRLAADHGIENADLHLVLEQSAMARVAPFTLVSVQVDGVDENHFLDLDAAQQTMLRETLFDDTFSEATLQRINLRENQFLRDVVFEARQVSAHARLAALARARAAQGV